MLISWASQQFGGSSPSVRIVPSSANLAYVVTRNMWGTALAFRYQRNVGGSGASDVGSPWQPWRRTGVFELPNFNTNPASPIFTFGDDEGAWDYTVQNNSNFRNGFSFHGGETIQTETVKIDGVAASMTVAVSGNSFELTHTSTCTWPDARTATNIWSHTVGPNGMITESMSITSAFGCATETYPLMDICGPLFTEVIVDGVTTNITANADYALARAPTVTLRSPTTGHTVKNTTNAPSIAGYASTFVRRGPSGTGQRSKLYFRRGTSSGAPLGTMAAARTIEYAKPS